MKYKFNLNLNLIRKLFLKLAKMLEYPFLKFFFKKLYMS